MYDMARGIGILLVVLGHTLTVGTYARALVYSFHMPLFFIISGAVMHEIPERSRNKTLCQIVARERKLLAFYVFYSLCFLIFDLVVTWMRLPEAAAHRFRLDIYTACVGYGINVLWFLVTLAFAKINVVLIAQYAHSVVVRIVIACVFFLVFSVLGNLIASGMVPGIPGSQQIASMSSLTVGKLIYYPIVAFVETLTMTGFVLLGYALRDILPTFVGKFKWVLPLLLVINILFCSLFGTIDYHQLEAGFPLLSLLMACTGSLAVLGLGDLLAHVALLRRFLEWCSVNSLFIMVVHEYLLIKPYIVAPIILAWHINDSTAFLVLAFLLQIVVLAPLCDYVRPFAERLALLLLPQSYKGRHAPQHRRS